VGVEAIAAVSVARPLRAGAYASCQNAPRSIGFVHNFDACGDACPRPSPRSPRNSRETSGGATRPRIQRRYLAGEAREDEPPADEFGRRDDIRMGDPPANCPVGLDGERLDLGLDDDVRQPRRADEGDDRRRRAVGPARLACRRVEAVRVEAVGDDEDSLAVPVERARIVVDRRRESRRPRAARTLEPKLRTAQRLVTRPDRGPLLVERAAGLRQREDRRRFAAARPSPPGAQAARVGQRLVARLARGRQAGTPSAIRATVASASICNVAGAIGNTAVPVPAAAQTTGNCSRSGSITTRTGTL
jgi:hypothetical protein